MCFVFLFKQKKSLLVNKRTSELTFPRSGQGVGCFWNQRRQGQKPNDWWWRGCCLPWGSIEQSEAWRLLLGIESAGRVDIIYKLASQRGRNPATFTFLSVHCKSAQVYWCIQVCCSSVPDPPPFITRMPDCFTNEVYPERCIASNGWARYHKLRMAVLFSMALYCCIRPINSILSFALNLVLVKRWATK